MMFGLPNLLKNWQVGDGREEKLAQTVLAKAKKGDALDVIRVIDEFAWGESFLMNVGDEKGAILDTALKARAPRRILELGTYCGYSAVRMAVAAPDAHIYSIELNAANAEIARRILDHAGVSDQVTVVVGTLGDGGKTIARLRAEFELGDGAFEFVFVDHDKKYYLSDLKILLNERFLAPGAVVVADNVKFPGAPDYLAYMDENETKKWRTNKHETHVEYQSTLKDLVLVSELLEA